jgi:hypothetical protein
MEAHALALLMRTTRWTLCRIWSLRLRPILPHPSLGHQGKIYKTAAKARSKSVEAYANQPGENGYKEPSTVADGVKIKQDIAQEALRFGEPYTTPCGFRFDPAAGIGGQFEPADPADGLPELRDEDMQSLFGDDNQEKQEQQRRRGPGSDHGDNGGMWS